MKKVVSVGNNTTENSGLEVRMVTFRETVGSSLLIKCGVGGWLTNALVDTAAQVSLLSEEAADRARLNWKTGDLVGLKGAAKQGTLQGRLVRGVSFTIGQKSYQWDVIVAPISDNVILGLDFLLFNRAVVDLDLNMLMINGQAIPSYIQMNEQGQEMQINRVFLKNKVVVPPDTMVAAKCTVDGGLTGEVCMTPFSEGSKSLLVPHSFNYIGEGRELVITIRNHSDRYISLKKKHLLGVVMLADVVQSNSSVVNRDQVMVSQGNSKSDNHDQGDVFDVRVIRQGDSPVGKNDIHCSIHDRLLKSGFSESFNKRL